MIRALALAVAVIALASPALAQAKEPATPASVVASAQAGDWIEIPPEEILIMEMSPAANGSGRYVVIQLMPPPFSQPWVENIRTLARAGWWDGTSVYRVVDNWVAQWGGGEGAGFVERVLPEGLIAPVADYDLPVPEDESEQAGRFGLIDPQAEAVDFLGGFPLAQGGDRWWPIHCYAHVGVARDIETTGTGSELYAVIGHAPRQLDRNIAVVGRVIEGIEHLSTLPRGTAEAGVYASRAEDLPIRSVRLASEHPDGASFRYRFLDTDSENFARYVAVRANRNDAFYTVPAGGVDICNVQVPVVPIEQ